MAENRRTRFPLFFTLFFLFPGLAAASPSVEVVQGQVMVDGREITGQAPLKKDQTVKTGPRSVARVVLEGGKKLKLDPNSQFKLQSNEEVFLDRGGMVAEIQKLKENQKFSIRTRSAVMGVRGTRFYTAIVESQSKKQDVWMCVDQGTVVATSLQDGKSVPVKAGMGVLIPQGETVTPPKEYPWTRSINWKMQGDGQEILNQVPQSQIYENPISRDYD